MATDLNVVRVPLKTQPSLHVQLQSWIGGLLEGLLSKNTKTNSVASLNVAPPLQDASALLQRYWPSSRRTTDGWVKELRRNVKTIVGYHHNTPIATVGIQPDNPDPSNSSRKIGPWVSFLLVDPDHRKNQIGYQMMRKTIQVARKAGYKKLYLFTNSAEHLYKKMGWKTFKRCSYKGIPNCAIMSYTVR